LSLNEVNNIANFIVNKLNELKKLKKSQSLIIGLDMWKKNLSSDIYEKFNYNDIKSYIDFIKENETEGITVGNSVDEIINDLIQLKIFSKNSTGSNLYTYNEIKLIYDKINESESESEKQNINKNWSEYTISDEISIKSEQSPIINSNNEILQGGAKKKRSKLKEKIK